MRVATSIERFTFFVASVQLRRAARGAATSAAALLGDAGVADADREDSVAGAVEESQKPGPAAAAAFPVPDFFGGAAAAAAANASAAVMLASSALAAAKDAAALVEFALPYPVVTVEKSQAAAKYLDFVELGGLPVLLSVMKAVGFVPTLRSRHAPAVCRSDAASVRECIKANWPLAVDVTRELCGDILDASK